MVDFRIEAAAVIMTQRGKISKGIYPFVIDRELVLRG